LARTHQQAAPGPVEAAAGHVDQLSRQSMTLENQLTIGAAESITDHVISARALLESRIRRVIGLIKDQVVRGCE
jgi:antitoxin component HigA of HigAB toxin-antitoxin module